MILSCRPADIGTQDVPCDGATEPGETIADLAFAKRDPAPVTVQPLQQKQRGRVTWKRPASSVATNAEARKGAPPREKVVHSKNIDALA